MSIFPKKDISINAQAVNHILTCAEGELKYQKLQGNVV
jgi:hypothetical protein